jgi:hypothetical protein
VVSFILGLAGGFIAWLATEFFGRPLNTILSLRSQAAAALARYESRYDPNPEAFEVTPEWLAERKAAYETCGAALVGFARSNSRFARILYKLRWWRISAESAGSSLLNLAELNPGGWAASQLEDKIEQSLKIGRPMARPFRKKRTAKSSDQ